MLTLNGASIYLFCLSVGLDLSFAFFMAHTLDAISSSCPTNLLICSCLCSLVVAPCRSPGLCHFGPLSAKMCTFTWINRRFKPKQPSVQKDGQFSSSSSLNTFATRERCRFGKQCLLFPCSCPWGPIKMDFLYPLIWSAYAVRLFFLPSFVCSWYASISSRFICLLSVLGTAVSIF